VHGRGLVVIVAIVLVGCQSVAPSSSAPGPETAAVPSGAADTATPPATAEAPATAAPTAAPTPAPTPTGFRGIVYQEHAGGRNWISTIQPDGSGHHRLPNPTTDIEPTLSPNGELIAFNRSSTAAMPGIYVMHADGSAPRRIAAITGHPVQEPAWSPDSKKIAFIDELDPGADFSSWAIYTVNVDGTGLKKVTSTSAGDRPAWSPDGKRIAFENSNGGGIWTISPSGTSLTQLTTGTDSDPAWSPDGTKVAFQRQDDSDPNNVVNHIFEATTGGALVVQVTAGTLDDEAAAWSPDGQSLLFSRFNSSSMADLYLWKSNGTIVAVTKTATISELTPSWH